MLATHGLTIETRRATNAISKTCNLLYLQLCPHIHVGQGIVSFRELFDYLLVLLEQVDVHISGVLLGVSLSWLVKCGGLVKPSSRISASPPSLGESERGLQIIFHRMRAVLQDPTASF
jgi:hypothetical protein